MIKEIKYNGYTSVPADYECPDGDLAGVVNMLPDEYGLTPIYPPMTQLCLAEGDNVVYVHKSNDVHNYIIENAKKYYYVELSTISERQGDVKFFYDLSRIADIYQVNSIGNTLTILTSDGIQYFLWQGTDNGYKHLGNHLPECPISFGLQGEMKRSESFEHIITNEPETGYELKIIDDFDVDYVRGVGGASHLYYLKEGSKSIKKMKADFIEDTAKAISNTVLAKVNKFIADETVNNGRFLFPFLVRYAYRMYDGSLIMHSVPVLMMTNSIAPLVSIGRLRREEDNDIIYNSSREWKQLVTGFLDMRVIGMVHQLDYAVLNQAAIDNLKNWKDIITSVDIFISKPLYTYDQNGKVTKVESLDSFDNCYSVCKNVGQAKEAFYPLFYQKKSYKTLYWQTFDPNGKTAPMWYMGLPQKEAESIEQQIKDCSNFYLLKAINIDDLKAERTIIDVNKEYLQSLVNRETMTDDYDSHDTLITTYSYTYNARFNTAGVKKLLFGGNHPNSSFIYTDKYNAISGNISLTYNGYGVQVDYYIKDNGRDILVRTENGVIAPYTPFIYLYHPNANVYKAVIRFTDYTNTYEYEVKMEPHAMLNGSVYFGGFDYVQPNVPISHAIPTPTPTEERIIPLPNKLYSSQINNPFYFPVENISTVGTGEIYAISSASKALSQGQFGQFPLYAFCSDGVWALSVSSTGGFMAVQPITRDVCITPKSITQLDTSVVFVSARGIVQLSGSNTAILTDTLKLEKLFDLTKLPNIEDIASLSQIQLEDIKYDELSKFLPGCRIIYAYVPQRLIVYNPSYPYAYVYSWKTKQWGLMHTNITNHVNSYPEALAMNDDNELVDFCENATTDDSGETIKGIKGIVLTRPLKLDNPDVLKTVDVMIQRGTFKKGHVKTVLYGSRDLYEWFMVWTSQDHYLRGFRGTPYKYFRVALICDLEEQESVYGATVQYTPRLTDQPR